MTRRYLIVLVSSGKRAVEIETCKTNICPIELTIRSLNKYAAHATLITIATYIMLLLLKWSFYSCIIGPADASNAYF